MHVCECESRCLQKPSVGNKIFGAGGIGACELPGVGAESQEFITAELPLWLPLNFNSILPVIRLILKHNISFLTY